MPDAAGAIVNDVVDLEQLSLFDHDTRLLQQLSRRRMDWRLPRLDATCRATPSAVAVAGVPSSQQQNLGAACASASQQDVRDGQCPAHPHIFARL